MQTREIPTHEWVPFLDDFSRRHQGEPVIVELFTAYGGAQKAAGLLPLIGVSVDVKDNEREQIEVIVGDSDYAHISHAIEQPRHIRLAQADIGSDQALQIESADGSTTLVRLEAKPNREASIH